jgi:serine/threonine protein kinase
LTTTFKDEVVRTEWKKRIGIPNAEDEQRLNEIGQFIQDALRQASLDLPGNSQILEELTQYGTIMGTPQYMAPEQASGRIETVGPSADIYSLGVMLYEMLTGRAPFSGGMLQVIKEVITSPPVPPRQRRDSIDPALEAICMKCLEKTIEGRYQSMGNLAEDLQRYISGAKVSALREVAPNSSAVYPAKDPDDRANRTTSVAIGTTEPGRTKSWWQFWR